jgi:hypothetical protein
MRRAPTGGHIRRPRPQSAAVVITAVVLAVFATACAGLSASATRRANSQLKAGMAELFTSYGWNTGLIGTSWWQSAVALSTVETYAQTTGDTSYDGAIARAFALNSSGNFENDADDDTGWWALVWLQAYDMTRIPSYLSMAETDADYIHEDWDDTCGGGVWWLRSPHWYKNAITNELFLQLTAWLHNTIPGDVKYLGWAEAEWSWFDHSGMINGSNLINDGLGDNCENDGDVTWTYNQGVILAGLAQLYRATGNRSLLMAAERIAQAAIGGLTVGGVLAEPCERAGCADRLDHNTQSFKGIFVQDLKILAVTARTARFNAFLAGQAQAIKAHDTGDDDQLGMYWAGPVASVSSSSQASALDALVAAVSLPRSVIAPRPTG